MKAEPDRLDLLIIAIPFVLVALLGVQIYRFVQLSGERVPALAALTSEPAAAEAEPSTAAGEPPPAGPVEPGEAAGRPQEEPAAAPGAAPATPEAGPGAADDASPAEAPEAGPGAADGGATPAAAADAGGDAGGTGAGPQLGTAPPSPELQATPPGGGSPAAGPAPVIGGAAAPAIAAAEGLPPDETAPAEDEGSSSPSGGAAPPSGGGDADDYDPSKPVQVSLFSPEGTAVKVGHVVPLEIWISNANNVGSVPFHLRYDSAILKLNDEPSAEKGDFLAVPGYQAQFLHAPGPGGNEVVVGLSLMGATRGASGAGRLATFYFYPIAPGTTQIVFNHATVRGPAANIIPSSFLPLTLQVTE